MVVLTTKVPRGGSRATDRRIAIRDELWPDAQKIVWNRKTEVGFTTIPRIIPLIMTLIDQLANGRNASRAYFDLWARAFDDGLVVVEDEESIAYSAGHINSGRNTRTWKERIGVLQDLGFIRVAPSGTRKYGYILILNPYLVVAKLKKKKSVPGPWWGAYLKRTTDVGAEIPH